MPYLKEDTYQQDSSYMTNVQTWFKSNWMYVTGLVVLLIVILLWVFLKKPMKGAYTYNTEYF